MEPAEAVVGAVLGCAVGDAIGLPYEGLSRRRGLRLLGAPDRHRFLFSRGMVSDDTEHTCLVAQALCAAPNDAEAFAQHLARHLRWWLTGVPAGIGLATLRATLRLWLGYPPARSGVFSAGNGPAMRSPVLGAAIADLGVLRSYVRASTLITHTDPKAFYGALAVAVAAWCARRGEASPAGFVETFRSVLGPDDDSTEFLALLAKTTASAAAGESTAAFADGLGCSRGVSGYVYHSVPVALHGWLSHPRDYPQAIAAVVGCGGDADTTAAMTGAVVGAGVGRAGIPAAWLAGLWEWPRSAPWMEQLAHAMAAAAHSGVARSPPPVTPVIGLGRNGVFLAVVLAHAARRVLPPY